MAKRSTTGFSFVIGVDKPAGMTSHDVVDRCRRIFGERRCGHTGTLDPEATGALCVCVGPATRLDRFLTAHDKEYEFTIVFGQSTSTDDATGEVIDTADVPDEVYDPIFAQSFVSRLVGVQKQMPPVYSAIKVDGRKSYEEARNGKIIELSPRDIEIYDAQLLAMSVDGASAPSWTIRASVSAGTYIRSIARDTGSALGTRAYVGDLKRTRSGNLLVGDCVTLDALEGDPSGALLDPVKLLGLRFVFANEKQRADVESGRVLDANGVELYAYDSRARQDYALSSCTSGVMPATGALAPDELVSIIAGNTLKAIYGFDAQRGVLKSVCGFAVGVKRGSDIQS